MLNASAQELYCTVQVISPQIEGTDKRVFQTLQSSIFDFINNRKWTQFNFGPEEKVECSILLTVEERISTDEFRGRLNIVLSRPVYGTAYNSPLLNFVDRDVQFRYIEYQPIDFAESAYSSELSSLLAYYVYILLGLDFDSFSPMGGTPYFQQAQAIVNAAQNSPYSGWRAFDNPKNRYWLVENCLNPSYSQLRAFIYEYHRKGMDIMGQNPNIGRSLIAQNLRMLEQVHANRPNLYLLQVLLETKRDEFMNLFSKGSMTEKTKSVNILSKIDPSNAGRYQQLLSNR